VSDKELYRRKSRQSLSELDPAIRMKHGAIIADAVWSIPEVAGARRILLFASMPSEVPTAPIAAEARSRGIAVVYPRCLPSSREMTLHAVEADDHLVIGSHGLLEPPVGCEPVDIASIDAAFVPGLAWDRTGGRLGRGAGYYDRFLSHPRWRGARIGLYFAAQEIPEVPMDDWDVPLDVIVTETEIVRPGTRR
jgi:5-formyltetrahydrofolate cyclo-ligase